MKGAAPGRNRTAKLPLPGRLFPLASLFAFAPTAHASTLLAFGSDWWLPPDYSPHGHAIDSLFLLIFWITMAVCIGCETLLIYFMIRYRHDPTRKKGVFTHGHTNLEMTWTIIPALIFLFIVMYSKNVWENYRNSPLASDPDRAQILVIGQQFKWNVIYPGPDGKLGRYLLFPKTTDLKWPVVPAGASFDFPPVPGPAYMKEEDARRVLNDYIDQINPLGKDFSDPVGVDDDWQNALSRPLEIPKGRTIDITLGSKDVIHELSLPNFRVKLDAVPGMKGHLVFVAEKSSAEFEKLTDRQYSLEELAPLIATEDWQIVVGPTSPKAFHERHGHRDWLYKDADGTIIRNGSLIPSAPDETGKTVIQKLRAIGVTQIEAFKPKYWDLVCGELCGQGHYTMQDKVIVLEDAAYRKKYGPNATAAAPAVTVAAAAGAPTP